MTMSGCSSVSLKPQSLDCAVAVVITKGVSGCEPAPLASSTLEEDGKRFSPAPGKANIYVVRPSIVGGRFVWNINIDGNSGGQIAAHTYLLLEVEPGTHEVTAITSENRHSFVVNANRGENYYLEAVSRIGWTEARAELRALPEEQGKTTVRNARRTESARAAQRPAVVAESAPGMRTTYVNPAYRWSVTYPGGWRLDDNERRSVMVSKGQARVGIHTGTGVLGLSLAQVADDSLRAWEEDRVGNIFTQISRRRVTLHNGLEAVEVIHRIGTGVAGKSRKIIAVFKDRGFWIDAETFLADWPVFERDFDAIIESFSVQE